MEKGKRFSKQSAGQRPKIKTYWRDLSYESYSYSGRLRNYQLFAVFAIFYPI